jgi:UDP-glucose 4-epimerase
VRLLVTGGAGYIGSVVVERAIEAGHDVTVLDNLMEGNRAAVDPAAQFLAGDAGDGSCLDGILDAARYDGVVHLAADASVAASMADPGLYFRNNVTTTLTLLDAMRRHGVERCVFSSTAAVYGEPKRIPIREDDSREPINAYGLSKLMCEQILDWYHRGYGIRSIAFRYFNAAGATKIHGEAHREETHLIPLVLGAALGLSPPVRVFGLDYPTEDGSCIRDFVHVSDIAEAHLAAFEAIDRVGCDRLNLGGHTGHSVLQVIDAARRVAGRDIPMEVGPRRPGDPAALVADASRAREVLGWEPSQSSLPGILESAWQWLVAHPRGYE